MTRAIVSCALGKPAEIRTSKNGKTFATFSVRESLNGSTRWWQAIAFNENVIEAVKELSVGEGLAVAGEIAAEIYAPAGSESRIAWRVTVDAVLTARKPKAKREKAGRKPKGANGRDRADASSWAAPTRAPAGGVAFNDDVPFAPEWR